MSEYSKTWVNRYLFTISVFLVSIGILLGVSSPALAETYTFRIYGYLTYENKSTTGEAFPPARNIRIIVYDYDWGKREDEKVGEGYTDTDGEFTNKDGTRGIQIESTDDGKEDIEGTITAGPDIYLKLIFETDKIKKEVFK